ncbi:MAG: type II toxin-antitoxin system MqsA family antitoxin [Pseudomonadota bacterium]
MLCTNCFNDEYQTTTIAKEVVINGRPQIINDIDCEKCPSCGDIVFTHEQSLALDKKRINLEFSSKPVMTPQQLKLLREILSMNLDEICEILHIGRNSYGRWERGEVVISPSMNLLIHQFMERFPKARVNLIEAEMQAELEKAKTRYLTDSVSLGEFIRNVIQATNILIDIVCSRVGVKVGVMESIANNDLPPESIPAETSANILKFFHLTMENLRRLFENTKEIQRLKKQVSFMHARNPNYGEAAESMRARSMNKIIEKYLAEDTPKYRISVNAEYLKKISACLQKEGIGGRF